MLNEARNVTLDAYLQKTGGAFPNAPGRPGVLILPGGAYQYCSDREAEPVAFAYLQAGYQAFVLRYSVGADATWPNPLEDYEQAMDFIREHAPQWGVYPDKIVVIGFSAGGHLAAAAATMSRNRPNAAILGYAVTGEDVKGCSRTAPSTIEAVDAHTCPCFLFATRTDTRVPVENTLAFLNALAAAGVSFESHIYSFGPHGLSVCDSAVRDSDEPFSTRVPNWVPDSIGWLKEILGDFGPKGMTQPACRRMFRGDYEPYLSSWCTVGHLMRHEQARPLLGKLTQQALAFGVSREQLDRMLLQTLLGMTRIPRAQRLELERLLSQIPNAGEVI